MIVGGEFSFLTSLLVSSSSSSDIAHLFLYETF